MTTRRKADPLNEARRTLYFGQRFLGDVSAAKRGKLGKRLIRRSVTRSVMRGFRW